jgi:DNA-binding MarR family transcriptional regulator
MKSSPVKPDDAAEPFVFELEHFLPYRLSLLTNTVSVGIAQSYRDKYDISVVEWRILAVLGRYPGLTASEIVDRTAMDKVAICRAVKNLVKKDLLQRKTDQEDRRRILLFITTTRGAQMLAEVMPLAQQYETKLLNSLDNNERKALSKAIQTLQVQAQSLKSKYCLLAADPE